VKSCLVVAAGAALVIGGVAACSSGPAPAKPKPGTLPAGTAQFTVNGKDAVTSEAVQCLPIESLTTIKIGNESSGVTAMVSNAKGLSVDWVRFNNLNGFTGSYDSGLQGDAKITMTGPTYEINGAATGFQGAHAIYPTTSTFRIKVSC
jgi:lipoprotein LpqH